MSASTASARGLSWCVARYSLWAGVPLVLNFLISSWIYFWICWLFPLWMLPYFGLTRGHACSFWFPCWKPCLVWFGACLKKVWPWGIYLGLGRIAFMDFELQGPLLMDCGDSSWARVLRWLIGRNECYVFCKAAEKSYETEASEWVRCLVNDSAGHVAGDGEECVSRVSVAVKWIIAADGA
jgi:hypothetical protein